MKSTTSCVLSHRVSLLRQSGLDVLHRLTKLSEQWARKTFLSHADIEKESVMLNRLVRIKVFLGWGWGYRCKSRKGNGGEKNIFFKAIFLKSMLIQP